jgi:organic hydroperoxide reductase OsmC/OhrA
MHPFPHHYVVSARGAVRGDVAVSAPGLPTLDTAPPPQFGGPEDRWSPETLLAGAVADCFILTFRAVARASGFDWQRLDCRVDAVLDRVEGQSRFVHYTTLATLTLAPGSDEARARALLSKAEQGCLVANSLSGTRAMLIAIEYATD